MQGGGEKEKTECKIKEGFSEFGREVYTVYSRFATSFWFGIFWKEEQKAPFGEGLDVRGYCSACCVL